MNNNVHLHSARGYDGLPNLAMPNYWTPWQSQAFPRSLANTETAKEVKAEMEKKEQDQKRKREGVPEMGRKRRMKGTADGSEHVKRNIVDQKKVPSKVGTLKSHLRERLAESIGVFHCLGDKTRKPSSFQPLLPQNKKRGISEEDVEFGFQNHVKKMTIAGDSTLNLVQCRSSCNPSAGSVPQLARERPHINTAAPCSQAEVSERGQQASSYWQSSPCLPQNGCSRIKFILEESTPIQPWQREEREAMKKVAQREREQAARVTKMGIDYINEIVRYRK